MAKYHRLEIWKNKETKEWWWHIKSKGRIICRASEGYKRRLAMMRSLRNMTDGLASGYYINLGEL